MGYMDIKGIGTWGDATQDIVDNALESYGYIYDRRYTKARRLYFYNKASRDKKLERQFNIFFRKELSQTATRKELLYHIRFGLGMLNISHPFDDKIRRG